MKRPSRSLGVLTAATILFAGCSPSSKTASAAAPSGSSGGSSNSASGAKAAGATYVASAPLSNNLTTATITDPTINNMLAATLTIPAGWNLQGIELSSPCTNGLPPLPVIRAYSPDGLMQYRIEPVMGWQWLPKGKTTTSGCAQISGVVSAANYLQSYLGTIQGGVHVIGSMPISAVYSQWAQGIVTSKNQLSSRGPAMGRPNNTASTAALRIQIVNGSFIVEERLRATVECTAVTVLSSTGGSCWARVDVLAAPEGKLDQLVQLVDTNNLPHAVETPQYNQAVMQYIQQRDAQQGAEMLRQGAAESAAASQRLYNAFQQDMASSASEHQAFMQQQESSFESSMNNANAAMNAQSTAASDFVDYALDQQTVAGPNGTAKVSSAYSQTWTNGTQWYQTNDPNTNPNGVLQGNWTQTTQVHGNGQPK